MPEIDPEGQENPEEIFYLVSQILNEHATLWLADQFKPLLILVLGKLPQPALKTLIERNTIIFAPDPNCSGRAIDVHRLMDAGDSYIVYLSPTLVQGKPGD